MRLNSDLTPQQLWTIAADSEHRDRDVLDELVSHPNSYRALSDWALAGLAVEDPRSLDVPPQPDAVEPVQKRKRRFPGLKAKKRAGGSQSGDAAPTSFSPPATGPGVMGPGRVGPAGPGPGVSGPGRVEAAATGPAVSGSGVSGPGVMGPGRVEPALSGPCVMGPGRVEPGLSGPGVMGPGRVEPTVSGPGVMGPGRVEPAVSGPGVMGPGRVEPTVTQAAHAGPGPSHATSRTPYGSAPSRKTANQQATTENSDPQTVPIDVQSEYRRRQEYRSRTVERPRSSSQDSDSSANVSHLRSPEVPQASASHTAHVGQAPFSPDSTTLQGGSGVPSRSGISDWVSAGERLSQSVRSPEPTEPQRQMDPHDVRSLPATWSSSPPPGTPLTPSAPRDRPQPTHPPVENGHKHTGWAAKPAPYGVVAALAALQVLTVLALLLVVVWGH